MVPRLLLILSSFSFFSFNPSTQEKFKDCVTPYGQELGESHGVKGFSNCNSQTTSYEVIMNEEHEIPSGMSWQCVEYARRYYQLKLGLTFKDVWGAHNIWDLREVEVLKSARALPFISYPNGLSTSYPLEGSLVIYPISEECPYGHVAVIVKIEVDRGQVYIAEQNWHNNVWPQDKSFSRILLLQKDVHDYYHLVDQDGFEILGWKYPKIERFEE